MATVTSASKSPAPTPATSQLPEMTSSLSRTRRRYSRFPRRIQLLPARRRRSRLRRAEPTISRTSPPKRRSRYLAQLSRRCQSRRQLRLDAVADHHQPPCQKYGHKLKQFLPDCVAGITLTPSFLTGQSATAKTTTARPKPSSNARRRHRRRSRSLLDLSVNADWDETAAELDDIGAVTDDGRSSVTLISIVTALPTKTVTTSSISSTSAERWVTPSGTMASSPWTVGRRSFRR